MSIYKVEILATLYPKASQSITHARIKIPRICRILENFQAYELLEALALLFKGVF
ncbi:MAG: hypothetical protein LBU14_05435 [Candidatus Peribacteria bacterium]|nr:hypothetical protein [Candidatus Peribacteria bacterium]